jgi:hopanoid biosynthesis associated protein HpnK
VRHAIITADDFGLDPAINEAVEQAFGAGVLTAASLMVGQVAAQDAIERARRMPGLRVGLHVTLTGARPTLPADRVADLVDRSGRLPTRLAAFGVQLAVSRAVRRQAQAEIRAQFEAFAAAGLELDHVNAHQHFHQHPIVLDAILRIGREFGMTAMRVPYEPRWLARRVPATARSAGSVAGQFEAAAWRIGADRIRRRLRAAGLASNDYLFGLRCSGNLDEATFCAALDSLGDGVVEVYLHPATRDGAAERDAGVGARATAEFAALMSPSVRARLRALCACAGGSTGGYRDIPGRALEAIPAVAG